MTSARRTRPDARRGRSNGSTAGLSAMPGMDGMPGTRAGGDHDDVRALGERPRPPSPRRRSWSSAPARVAAPARYTASPASSARPGMRRLSRSCPPGSARRSSTVTAWPRRARTRAASSPAGPRPRRRSRSRPRRRGRIAYCARARSGFGEAEHGHVLPRRSLHVRHATQERSRSSRPSWLLRGISGSACSARPSVTKSASPASRICAATLRVADPAGHAHRDRHVAPDLARDGARQPGVISMGWTIHIADS